MSPPNELIELVERFERNIDAYNSGQYNEAQVRQEYIDPLFELLGWDMRNRQGYAEAYKDVIHEDSLQIGGTAKAPDYCFRIGGTRKFFLEAKKPSVDIKGDIGPAYQVRRYAWSAKLPLSILTDFEELAIYDCRVKPDKNDRASRARTMYFTFDQYPERWDEISSIFSRDAVLKGSFDKYAEEAGKKRGTSEVDKAFLAEIESWRDTLARNIALRNPYLTQRELNLAVQKTIDRIIFLRICEDRGIEKYLQLMSLQSGPNTYKRLLEQFRNADQRYNSGLFHFSKEKGRPSEPDTLTSKLAIDDKALKGIIKNLYYPDSPYEFSVLPADILGQVYEQFLGKVIRLSKGHRAVVEDKPEVKKAGGVYYTPTYIVDYIVKNTVGKLLKRKTPKQAEKLRILDPACGSGSFLIGAYQCLLDWHREYYQENDPEKLAKRKVSPVYQGPGGEWRLTTSEKKRILLNNIYGVDIDHQAVEVTKLSLLLKVLEDENRDTLQSQLTLFKERALPDLGNNIKCGNSLIGPDFYDEQQISFGNEDELYSINVFDWSAEFTTIMKAGGFDTVIGNPPYVRSQSLGVKQRDYYKRVYHSSIGTYDMYVLFVERAISLMNPRGVFGYILPNKFFTTDYGEGLRKILVQNKLIEKFVDFEDAQVFEKAGTYTNLLFLANNPTKKPEYVGLGDIYKAEGRIGLRNVLQKDNLKFDTITLTDDGSRWTIAAGSSGRFLNRIKKQFSVLNSLKPHIFQGLKTSADKIYMVNLQQVNGDYSEVKNQLNETFVVENAILKPVVKGENVQSYYTDLSNNLRIIYPYKIGEDQRPSLISADELNGDFPLTWEYLHKHSLALGARDRGIWAKRPDWYAYARSQNIATFIGPKYLIPYMTTDLRANYDINGEIFFVNIATGGYGLRMKIEKHHEYYFLALLNSSLLNYFCKHMTNKFRGGYYAINKQALERLPMRTIKFSDSSDLRIHDKVVDLVEQMLVIKKRFADTKAAHEKINLQRQIDAIDRLINSLVYELYGLTDKEIRIVEDGK